MPRPCRKPFWRWTPLPWAILLLLMLATGSMQDVGAGTAFRILLVVTIVFAAAFAAGLIVAARRRDPAFTAEGRLARLDGLGLVRVPAVGHPVIVADTRAHQHAIDAARSRAGAHLDALLVPDSGNWWNLRLDVAVYLLEGERCHLAGRLPDQAQVAWQERLDALRREGRHAVVPAEIAGAARPFALDVRLEGLRP